jgi:hypothetical protein
MSCVLTRDWLMFTGNDNLGDAYRTWLFAVDNFEG